MSNQVFGFEQQQVDNRAYSVCCIGLGRTDRIKLIGIQDEKLKFQIQEAINAGWPYKIRKQEAKQGVWEFKVDGNPWRGQGSESVHSRKLLTHLLMCMARNGWNLLQSADTNKSQWDRDTLFFEPGPYDIEVRIFALSFNLTDRIRLIDCPELYPALRETVRRYWPRGIQEESQYHGAMEIKLRGNPFWAERSENINDKEILLTHIITTFRLNGYKLYGSCDINVGHEGHDLESWVFRKINPFYH